MKLSHLRDVLAVVELGSLRAAGRRLGIPQPLITRSIRQLEHELGASLFERHARGVRLTDIGKAFVRRAAIVESELQRARDEVEQLKGQNTGQVSIALSAASVLAILPATLPSFHKRYPDALLKIAEALFQTVAQDLLDGRTDFYVGPFDRSNLSAQFSVEQLFDNRRLIVARRGHPLSNATSIADLAEAGWIRPTLSAQTSEADFESYLREMGIDRPRIVMHTRSALATLVAVLNSDLLSILPQQWLEFGPTAQGLATFDVIGPMAAAPICIVRRSDLPLTPMAEHLSDLIRRAGKNYGRQR
jgi:LysR family transcriptional regulator, regulator of abg operon